jgi:WD40 repeat protein
MEWISDSFIIRPNEYERLVADLIDRRFFGPVAITTSLPNAHGLGKTSLARAISRDVRILEAFPDGIMWVTLGENLSPLQILSKIERLIYDISGERRGLIDLKSAQQQLYELVHPLQFLLILDEANDPLAIRHFLQTGPAGACLIVSNTNELPFGARCTPVDIMFRDEAVQMLIAGLPLESHHDEEYNQGPGEFSQSDAEENPDPAFPLELEDAYFEQPTPSESGGQTGGEFDALPFMDSTGGSNAFERLESIMAGPDDFAVLEEAEKYHSATNLHLTSAQVIPMEHAGILFDLAERLNEWPLLLALVNGLLREWFDPGERLTTADVIEAVQAVNIQLDAQGMQTLWLINDPKARAQALSVVINTCLEPLTLPERERFFDLVVFPPDEGIPLAAVSVLWETSLDDTRSFCLKLARRNLVSFEPITETIQLHQVLRRFILDQCRAGALPGLHNRIIESYRPRCPAGWASGPDDGYFFYHLADHFYGANRRGELQALLFDFDWLVGYLNCIDCLRGRRGDLYSLLNDFELALSTSLDRQSAELRLVQDALRLAAPVLAKDPMQLAPQLLGRLLPFEEPEIQSLLERANRWSGRTWLRPLAACFTPPGGDEVRTLTGHEDWVTGVAILRDGQYAVSASLDGTLREWNLPNGHNTRLIAAQPDGVSAMAVSPDGCYAISSGWDGVVRVWDLRTWENKRTFKAHIEAVGALAVTPDGRHIITGANDRLIRVWDFETGLMQLELVGHGDLVRSLAVSPDGRTLISGSWDYTVRLWDLENGKQIQLLTGHESWVRAVAFSPDGSFALSGGWDRTLKVWDLWTGETIHSISGFKAPIFAIIVLPDNRHALIGGADGSFSLWNLERETLVRALDGHAGGINCIALTDGARFAVSASDDRTLRIWDLVALQGTHPQPGHSAPVYSLSSLPDRRYSVSGSWDGTIKIWDTERGLEVCTLNGHSGGVVSLAVSSDGRIAVSGSRDHSLKVWDLEKGQEVRTLPGHAGAITSVSINPAGTRAVSGADDGTLKAWDLETGACLAEFRGEGAIWACALAHDGSAVAASATGGKMYFLEIKSSGS